MAVSSITLVSKEEEPQGLSSFLRSGQVYVVWSTSIFGNARKIRWKPHGAADFTETIPALNDLYRNVTALYDPVSDNLVLIWDDGLSFDGTANGTLFTARFNPVSGAIVSGPTPLFEGALAQLSYRSTTPDANWMLYYRTPKTGGVYGKISKDGGITWQSGYPLLTSQVLNTQKLDAVPLNADHASVAQLGTETRGLMEIGMLQRTRPLQAIVKHPTVANNFFIGEPSKGADDVTLIDNLRGGLTLSTDHTKLYHLDGVQKGTSDSVGAVAKIAVTGTVISVSASDGPTGNGDDVNEYDLVPASGALNVDLSGASFATQIAVSAAFAYVAEYADNSGVLGQLSVVNLSTGATGTPLSGITGVRAVGVANFLSPALIFVGTTESGVDRLRVYEENALTPTLLVNTKLSSRANSFNVVPDPNNINGALVYASLVDRLNVYRYTSSSAPLRLDDTFVNPGGGSFFQSLIATNGNVFAACGNAGVVVISADGRIVAQRTLSGRTVPQWAPSTVFSAGAIARPRDGNPFGKTHYYFTSSAGGTTNNSEPRWDDNGTIIEAAISWTPVGKMDGVVTGIALDESTKRVYAVGSVGGVLGTNGRVWILSATGLL